VYAGASARSDPCRWALDGAVEDRGRPAGTREQGDPLRRRRHLSLEQLAHDAERELALELRPPRGQHPQPPLGGEGTGVLQKPCRADTDVTLDDEEPPVSVCRLVDDLRDHRDLVLAVEDR